MTSETKALQAFKKETGLSIQQGKIAIAQSINKGLFPEIKGKRTILNLEGERFVLRFNNLKIFV